MITIIYAHPWDGSLNKAILETVINGLNSKNEKYQIIDLNKDNFNPVLTQSELALFSKGEHQDPLVTQYQSMLKNTNELIIIFPIWWYDVPAILKGFWDKVMLKGFAYTEGSFGLKGELTHIRSAKVITTAQSPRWYLKMFAGNPIQGTFINASLKGVGIKNVKWYHCSHITKGDNKKREAFLTKLQGTI